MHDRLVELGRFGQKAGKGWYRYDESADADAGSRSGGVDSIDGDSRPAFSRARFSDDEIVRRLMLRW